MTPASDGFESSVKREALESEIALNERLETLPIELTLAEPPRPTEVEITLCPLVVVTEPYEIALCVTVPKATKRGKPLLTTLAETDAEAPVAPMDPVAPVPRLVRLNCELDTAMDSQFKMY